MSNPTALKELSWCSNHHNVEPLEIQGPCWERGKPCSLCEIEELRAAAKPATDTITTPQGSLASNELVSRLNEAAARIYEDGSRIGCYVNPDEAATLLAALRSASETPAELMKVGQLIALDDDTATVVTDWDELRYKLPPGTKLYVKAVRIDYLCANCGKQVVLNDSVCEATGGKHSRVKSAADLTYTSCVVHGRVHLKSAGCSMCLSAAPLTADPARIDAEQFREGSS